MYIPRICALTALLTFTISVHSGATPLTGDGDKLAEDLIWRSDVFPPDDELRRSGDAGHRFADELSQKWAPARAEAFEQTPGGSETLDETKTSLGQIVPAHGLAPVWVKSSAEENSVSGRIGNTEEQTKTPSSPFGHKDRNSLQSRSGDSRDSGDPQEEPSVRIAPASETAASPGQADGTRQAPTVKVPMMRKSRSETTGSAPGSPLPALGSNRYLGGSGENEYIFVLDFMRPSCALYLPVIEGLLQGGGRVAVRHAPHSFQGASLALVYEAVLRISPERALELLKWIYRQPLEQRQNPAFVYTWFLDRGPDFDPTKIALLVGTPEVQKAVTDDLDYVKALDVHTVPALIVNGVVRR